MNIKVQDYKIAKTEYFWKWLKKQPQSVSTRIDLRLDRVKKGNMGNYKDFGDIGELKFDFGKGYRVYFTVKGQEIILLLLGGDKKSQDDDVKIPLPKGRGF